MLQLFFRSIFRTTMPRVIAGTVLLSLVSFGWTIHQRQMFAADPFHRQTLSIWTSFILSTMFCLILILFFEGIHQMIAIMAEKLQKR